MAETSDASATDEPSTDILMVQGLIIPTDDSQPVTSGMIDASPLGMCLATGGGLYEGLTLDHDGGMMWLNMYGKSEGLAVNVRATRLAEHFRPGFASVDYIAGPVMVVGTDPETFGPADVPTLIALVAIAARVITVT